MPSRYFSDRDIRFMDSLNEELVGQPADGKDGIINQEVVIYKVSVYDTLSNLYGESSEGKRYKPGVQLACLIAAEDFDYQTDQQGPDLKQTVSFSFLRQSLVDINFVIEIGDVIDWNNAYFEIASINENQLVGGKYDKNWAVVCNTILKRRVSLNIELTRSK